MSPKHEPEAPRPQGKALAELLLAALRKNPQMTQQELMQSLSLSRAAVQRIIKDLSASGVIARKGGKRYGCWVTADAGKQGSEP